MPRRAALVLLASLAFACALRAPAGAGEVVASQQARFEVVELAGGLAYPWGLAFLPEESGGGILITERPGRLRLFRDGRLGPPIDGMPEVATLGQGGLLDVALHPAFAENRWIYLSYSARGSGGYGTRVARARLEDEQLEDARLENLRVVYDMGGKTGSVRRFGSRLLFGAEGDLYVSLGDRGDPERAQNPSDSAGSVLRLTGEGVVPPDNPFAGRPGHDPRVYAYGLRDPQGLALQPETGAVWVGEHGSRGGDELNRLTPGANYGWPRVTYGFGAAGSSGAPGLTGPAHYWAPPIAPSGMAFYRGEAFPQWQGDLFVGALDARMLVRLDFEDGEIVGEEHLLQDALGRIRAVGAGPDGLIYLLTAAGEGGLYRLQPVE